MSAVKTFLARPCRPLLALLAALGLSGPALGQEPPPAPHPGPWVLTPIPGSGVPQAWLLNSATGDAYLCTEASTKTSSQVVVGGACVPMVRGPLPQPPPGR
jgi:hypothetical protein